MRIFAALIIAAIWQPFASAMMNTVEDYIQSNLASLNNAIYRVFGNGILNAPLVVNEAVFLSGHSPNSNTPLRNPIIDGLNPKTQQTLWGLYNAASWGGIQGISLTLADGSYLRYYSLGVHGVGLLRGRNGTCEMYEVSLISGLPFTDTPTVEYPCNPLQFSGYQQVAVLKSTGSFLPAVSEGGGATEWTVLVPYAASLINASTSEVLGVVAVNISVQYLDKFYGYTVQPSYVSYVMSSATQNYSLIASSIGELVAQSTVSTDGTQNEAETSSGNGALISALVAKNAAIRLSAALIGNVSVPNGGGTYSLSDESNGLTFIIAARPYKENTNTAKFTLVSVSFVHTAALAYNASSYECALEQYSPDFTTYSAAQASAVAVASTASAYLIVGGVTAFLANASSVAEAPAVAGGGPPVQLDDASPFNSTAQFLWGLTYTFAVSNEVALGVVDAGTGAYLSYSQLNAVAHIHPPAENASCAALPLSSNGGSYPAIANNCAIFDFTSTSGVPSSTPYQQILYDVRSSIWYETTKNSGSAGEFASFYGTTTELFYGKEGVMTGLPLFARGSSSQQFIGAVQVFIETSVLSGVLNGILSTELNVSYIMTQTSQGYLLASSESSPTTLLTEDGTAPLAAENSTNVVIAKSAKFVTTNAIRASTTAIFPLDASLDMVISTAPLPYFTSEQFSVGWLIVAVKVMPNAFTETTTKTSPPTPSTGNSDGADSWKDVDNPLDIALIASLIFMFILLCSAAVWYYSVHRNHATSKSAAGGQQELTGRISESSTLNPVLSRTV